MTQQWVKREPPMNDLNQTGPYQPVNGDEVAAVIPERIGRYRIERVLGKGGFGLVYLAHDEQLQRLLAIKVPHRKLVDRPEAAEAYLTEARTVANLDHPNIVPVHDVGSTEDGPCYVVSKYIDGTDRRKSRGQDTLMESVQTDQGVKGSSEKHVLIGQLLETPLEVFATTLKCRQEEWVEMSGIFLHHNPYSIGMGQRRFINTLGPQSVVHICNGDDAGRQGNFLARQSVRIAVAVEALVMMAGNFNECSCFSNAHFMLPSLAAMVDP